MTTTQNVPHPVEVACEFMKRAQLTGAEVDAYAKTYNWLQSILSGELTCLPTDTYNEQQAAAADTLRELDAYKEAFPDFKVGEDSEFELDALE